MGGSNQDIFSDDEITDGYVIPDNRLLLNFDDLLKNPLPQAEIDRQVRESKRRKAKVYNAIPDHDGAARMCEGAAKAHAEEREQERVIRGERFADEVDDQKLRILGRREALRQIDGGSARDAIAKLPTPETLDEMIEAEGDAVMYRFDRLMLVGGNTLVCGNNKAGKTERTLEIVRSLLTGDDLFGEFEVSTPLEGDILYLNYELSKKQFAHWLDRMGIPGDRIRYLNLRGFNNVPLMSDAGAEWLLSYCDNVEALVLDPAARMIQAAGITDEDRNDAIKPLCGRLDEIKEQGGIRDLILPIHANRAVFPLRPRGADYWGSWMDSQVTIEKTTEKKKDTWYLSAFGRDIDVPRSKLHRDDSSFTCRVDTPTSVEPDPEDPLKAQIGEKRGAGRPGRSEEQTKEAVFDYLNEHPTHSQNRTYDEIGGTKALVRKYHREWTAQQEESR